jgi:hypothetical protein
MYGSERSPRHPESRPSLRAGGTHASSLYRYPVYITLAMPLSRVATTSLRNTFGLQISIGSFLPQWSAGFQGGIYRAFGLG